MRRPDGAKGRDGAGQRAGFTLLEALAALAVTAAVVAVALPYAGRLATHWWVGERAVEAADAWMQAESRMADDVAQAIPYRLGGEAVAFRAGPDRIALVRPALGDGPGLEAVSYEVRPSSAGAALVRRSRPFDPAAFARDDGGAPAPLLDGPFRLRLVVVAPGGARRRGWAPEDGMPAAVELSASGPGRGSVPVAPALMPVAARAPAVASPPGAGAPGAGPPP